MIKAVFGVLKFRWLLNLIPGVGPFLAAAAEAIVAAVKYVCRGLLGIVTNPANLAAAVTIAMVMTIVGIKLGVKLDAHLVREAKQETKEWKDAHAKLVNEAKAIDAADKSKHKNGLRAKAKAEADEKAKIADEKKAAVTPGPTAKRVQPAPGKAASCHTKAQPPGLLGPVSALFGPTLKCKS